MNQVDIELKEMKVSDLKGWSENPREISVAAMDGLRASIERFGVVSPIIWNAKTGRVVSGHQRLRVLREKGIESVKVIVTDLDEQDEKFLNVTLNNAAITGDFTEGIAPILEELRKQDTILFSALQMSDIVEALDLNLSAGEIEEITGKVVAPEVGPVDLAALKREMVERVPDVDEEGKPREKDFLPPVPDALFETDNEWGVPVLDITMQATCVEHPILHWHDFRKRMTRMNVGSVHFYIDDFYFNVLWEQPNFVFDSCKSITEPNFSVYDNMPKAVGLYQLYKKRWLARYWQMRGVRIFVDIYGGEKFKDYMFLGVPKGWKAFSTRFSVAGYEQDREGEKEVLDMIYSIAGTKKGITFMVVGGGKAGAEFCRKHGFVNVEETLKAKQDARKAAAANPRKKKETGEEQQAAQ